MCPMGEIQKQELMRRRPLYAHLRRTGLGADLTALVSILRCRGGFEFPPFLDAPSLTPVAAAPRRLSLFPSVPKGRGSPVSSTLAARILAPRPSCCHPDCHLSMLSLCHVFPSSTANRVSYSRSLSVASPVTAEQCYVFTCPAVSVCRSSMMSPFLAIPK